MFEFGLILPKIFQFENLNPINCYTTNASNTKSKLQLSAFLRFCYNTHNSFRFISLIQCQLFLRTRWSVRLGIVRLDIYRGKQNEWYKKCWMERGNSEICTSLCIRLALGVTKITVLKSCPCKNKLNIANNSSPWVSQDALSYLRQKIVNLTLVLNINHKI